MRHDNLDARQIRALVKSDAGMAERDHQLEVMIEAICIIVGSRFSMNKKLSGHMLADLFKRSDNLIRDRFRPLDYQHDRKPGTRVHPKGEQIEACYSMLVRGSRPNGVSDIYQLVSMRLLGSRKSFQIDLIAHPVGFTYHVAERLMERTGMNEDAMDSLGRNLSKWMPFTCVASRHLDTDGGCAVPMDDNSGMLIGEMSHYDISVGAMRYVINKAGVTTIPSCMSHEPEVLPFVARTFVDRHQLRPAQAYSMKLLSDWNAENDGARYENEVNLLWPWSFNTDNADDIGDMADNALNELLDVVDDPVLVRAFHTDPDISRSFRSDDDLDLGEWAAGDCIERQSAMSR